MASPAVLMSDITKTFPGIYRDVIANNKVDLSIEKGEIHLIIGENGAGKTTIMNILYGMIQPDSGKISINGKVAKISDPQEAINLGINMIHQHFMLVPSFTIGENIVLGKEPTKGLLIDRKKISSITEKLASDLGLKVDPDVKIMDTTVGVQQKVEILKAMYREAKILILDESTAILTPQEINDLLNTLKSLASEGTTIILITHKLSEVKAIADNVTILRDGHVVGKVERNNINENKLAELMTGRLYKQKVYSHSQKNGDIVLEAKNISCSDERNLPAINNISFNLKSGEIVGIAGVAGNGQEELAEVLTGQRNLVSGNIILADKDISNWTVREIRDFGMGHIPDDRYLEGCAKDASVSRNFIMGIHHKPPIGGKVWLNQKNINSFSEQLIDKYDIKLNHQEMSIQSLSGGNVQKVIVAREINIAKKCLIAEQPTRGVDIGASENIYNNLQIIKNDGIGILLISNDLNEIMRMSDRILVIYNGQIIGESRAQDTSSEEIGLLMAGIIK